MLPSPKPKKYRLSVLIEELCTAGRKKPEVIDELCELLGIKVSMLHKYRSCRQGDLLSLSGNQLSALAGFFSCSIDDLFSPVKHEEANA